MEKTSAPLGLFKITFRWRGDLSGHAAKLPSADVRNLKQNIFTEYTKLLRQLKC